VTKFFWLTLPSIHDTIVNLGKSGLVTVESGVPGLCNLPKELRSELEEFEGPPW